MPLATARVVGGHSEHEEESRAGTGFKRGSSLRSEWQRFPGRWTVACRWHKIPFRCTACGYCFSAR